MLRCNNELTRSREKAVGAGLLTAASLRLMVAGREQSAQNVISAWPTPGQGIRGKIMGIIIWLIVGAIAGWLAGMVVKGGGFGLIGDIIVGIVGGLIAGWLLPRLGIFIGGDFIGDIINAFIGAVILLIILRIIKR